LPAPRPTLPDPIPCPWPTIPAASAPAPSTRSTTRSTRWGSTRGWSARGGGGSEGAMTPNSAIVLVWVGWWLSWIVAARWSAPSEARAGTLAQITNQVPTIIGTVLLFVRVDAWVLDRALWPVSRVGAWASRSVGGQGCTSGGSGRETWHARRITTSWTLVPTVWCVTPSTRGSRSPGWPPRRSGPHRSRWPARPS
jgi:hypothetical protein